MVHFNTPGADCSQSEKEVHWLAGRFKPYKLKPTVLPYIKNFTHHHHARREARPNVRNKDRDQRAVTNDLMPLGKFLSESSSGKHSWRHRNSKLYFGSQQEWPYAKDKRLLYNKGKRFLHEEKTSVHNRVRREDATPHQILKDKETNAIDNKIRNPTNSQPLDNEDYLGHDFTDSFSPKFGFEYNSLNEFHGYDPKDFGLVINNVPSMEDDVMTPYPLGAGPPMGDIPFPLHPSEEEVMAAHINDLVNNPAFNIPEHDVPPPPPIYLHFAQMFPIPLMYPTIWWYPNHFNAINYNRHEAIPLDNKDTKETTRATVERQKRSALTNSGDLLHESSFNRAGDDIDREISTDSSYSLKQPLLARSSSASVVVEDAVWILGGYSFIELPFLLRYNVSTGEIKPVEVERKPVPSYRHGHTAVHFNVSC